MEQRLMVKQRVGEIPANASHPRMEVFASGVSGWYIFAPMQAPGISGTIHFPVQGKDLVRGWKRLLV